MTGKKILYFVIAVGICLLAGYIGSYYTTPAIPTWYAGLQKPDINPPSWVFAPVWTVLYILMGISLYLILQSNLKSQEVQFGLILFIFQLMVNIGWSFFFFGLQSTFFGFLALYCHPGMAIFHSCCYTAFTLFCLGILCRVSQLCNSGTESSSLRDFILGKIFFRLCGIPFAMI
jgi:tryptophan-rich sensory protein